MHRLAIIPVLSSLAAALSLPVHAETSSEYAAGLAAVREYRYAEAGKSFLKAAAQGDRDAQRIHGLMLLYGERLYGVEVHADRSEAFKWLKLAARQGDEVSALLLKRYSAQAMAR